MPEFLSRFTAQPRVTCEMLVATLLLSVLALASPLFVIQVLNRYIAHGVDATLATLTVGAVFAVLLELGFRQVRLRFATVLTAEPDRFLSDRTFERLTRLKLSALTRVPAGRRQEIIRAPETIQSAFSGPNLVAMLDFPFALLFFAVLFFLSPTLAGVTVVFALVTLTVGVNSMVRLHRPSQSLEGATSANSVLAASALHGADTVRAFNAGSFLRLTWQNQRQSIEHLRRRLINNRGLAQSLTLTSGNLMSIVLIAVAALMVVDGQLSVGAMIGANILARRALAPIAGLTQLASPIARALYSMGILSEFERLPVEAAGGTELPAYAGGLEFKDVGYVWPGERTPLFESLNLTLPAGAVLVVGGGNGTGKTTFCRMVTGLLEPTRGHVLADGVDLAQLTPHWWRSQFIYLPQEPIFLNTTIAENLRVSKPELDDGQLLENLTTAGLRHFVDVSPQGLQTPVGEQGRTLAVGVRRRLALARALGTGGKLVLFDEPTEGLDAEGCQTIYQVLNQFSRSGKTIIACSADPNIVKGARFVLDLNTKPVPAVVSPVDWLNAQALQSEKFAEISQPGASKSAAKKVEA